MSKKDKGRLPQFVPLLHLTIKTPAWLAMSHGAKALYIALKSHVPNQRNEAFLSHRDAAKEVGSCRRKIAEWFLELEHYGFIVMTQPRALGVEGKGKAPHWRLTEMGCTRRTSADGQFQPPTNDFLRWDGVLFQRKTKPRLPRGCQGGDYVGASGGDTWSPPKPVSGDYGGAIQTDEGGDYGGAITSLTTIPALTAAPLEECKIKIAPSLETQIVEDDRTVALRRRETLKPWTILSDEPRDLAAYPAGVAA